jgi:hypothetical protein
MIILSLTSYIIFCKYLQTFSVIRIFRCLESENVYCTLTSVSKRWQRKSIISVQRPRMNCQAATRQIHIHLSHLSRHNINNHLRNHIHDHKLTILRMRTRRLHHMHHTLSRRRNKLMATHRSNSNSSTSSTPRRRTRKP